MIEYVKGELAELAPAMAVVDCHGVGYSVNISLNTYSSIQGKREVKLYIHEAIREDAYVLWGFASKQERELFLMLITVSGIGGNTARMILSSLTPSELVDVISSGNDKLLKTVKGIGLKTAQRIIVELRDKIALTDTSGNDILSSITQRGESSSAAKEIMDEAVAALTMLGFQASASQKVVAAILKADPSQSVEAVIKLALKQL
ncbi:MAG: Holliday junction branch migration protein RuvA [Bacteroidaceae bacterium]|nr:Holliday junction branch migration protein RuvA [Bacteroidaceae bacterium]